jgi:hypothetical protein
MASNKYTQQTPLAGSTVRAVIAERCYIAPNNTAYADPGAKLDGADPAAPWADLGIVAGSKVALTYNKTTSYIETGIEKIRRGAYIMGKTAQAVFTLEQFDMGVLEQITGLTATALGGAIGKKIHIGQEDLVEKSLLFVGTNKVDDKEYQTYCKSGAVTFNIEDSNDSRVLKVTADLFAFTPSGETKDAFFTMFILD